MAIKWKNFSHSLIAKIIVFIIVMICFSGSITVFLNYFLFNDGDLSIILEDSYYVSYDCVSKLEHITDTVAQLITRYKSEEYIRSGKNISEHEIEREKEILFEEFQRNSKKYNPNLSNDENYEIFKEAYSDKILQEKNKIIDKNLKDWNSYLRTLDNTDGILYYASDGENIFTNSPNKSKQYFKSSPVYLLFDKSEEVVYPKDIKKNRYYGWIKSDIAGQLDQNKHALYVAFTDDALTSNIEKWKINKAVATDNLYIMVGFLFGLLLSFVYLLLVIGRKSFKDDKLHLNFMDKLYNDINIVLCLGIIASWFFSVELIREFDYNEYKVLFPITFLIGTLGLTLVLSLVKHIKNRTIIKHTLIYTILNKLFRFIKEIYDSGTVGIKISLIVIGYPILVALTFFMFPITIGIGVWLALKKVKEFNAIKEGVEKIKNGNIHHTIKTSEKGEFGKLASNINSIADGLNKAVANELKSERLKTELISNVSHDIRTPLTSIITYIDLLKNEGLESENAEKYLDVLDQKSLRLKSLTDDLFEASKASSGSIPVNIEDIDLISLITQGMGELDDKIAASGLDFKFNYPKEKVFVKADGKLLWRVIENLMSNIFKYALENSRVYINVIDSHNNASIIIKNISSYELNIDADELMERFKRGDESRNSEGSGLGLSIAKSLVELQNGKFNIEIDGDLFKSIIVLPK